MPRISDPPGGGVTTSRRRAPRRRGRTGPLLAATVVIAGLSLVYALATASPDPQVPRPNVPLRLRVAATGRALPAVPYSPPVPPVVVDALVAISARAPMTPIPESYLGVSTEYWTLPLWGKHLGLLERVLSLVHGPGPLVLRIGGDSADRTFWSPARHMPGWAYELTPKWMREVGTLVRTTGARLILDLNQVTATPAIAARWAAAAESQLPAGSIMGFEIGNEPDLYSPGLWLAGLADKRVLPPLPAAISAANYELAFRQYAAALAKAAPGAPLFGPALGEPEQNLSWLTTLLAHPHPGLDEVTVHRYPYWGCAPRTFPSYPTISRLLSEQATAGMAQSVVQALVAARRAHLPLRLTELNSVNCGGVAGVSNSFATALWAPDALFELLHVGVSAVNIHVRAEAVNAAFAINRRGLQARPLLYGMLIFQRMLGTHAQLVSVRLAARPRLQLKAWAVRSGRSTLRVLLIDKGPRALIVQLVLPARGRATVQRLLARSPSATGGVTFAGQHIGAGGHWAGRLAIGRVAPTPAGYIVSVRPYSAEIVKVRLRSGALRTRRSGRA